MRKLLLPVVLILVALAAYVWFVPEDDSSVLQTDQELMPDYVAQNITRRLFNSEGYLADVVSAERLEHFELLGFTQFEKPLYTLYNDEHKPSWQASSEYAVWFAQDKIILEQDVNIVSLSADELFEKIHTENLEMLFPDNQLRSNLPVVISGQGFEIRGTGLEADLRSRQFKLLQHQQTVYRHEE